MQSYGVGARVKLPGPTQREPNVYEFGTPYESIYDELAAKDSQLYTRNGLLAMLERNMAVKEAPQRWQDERRCAYASLMQSTPTILPSIEANGVRSLCSEEFDVVIAFEERVFEEVVSGERRSSKCHFSVRPILTSYPFSMLSADMSARGINAMEPVLIINLDVKDNHEEAATAAPIALDLCEMIEQADEWDTEFDRISDTFAERNGRRPLYTICWR